MYSDILVPTDGSDAAEAAVNHAVRLASNHDARLHGLYVVDSGSYATMEIGSAMITDALRTEGERSVGVVADAAAAAGVDAVTDIVEGPIADGVLDYAADHGIDLIVMGTHGRSGLDRYLLGSVTERVVRSSTVPVLTVRSDADADS
jgi:nucleotide-binding universal stress UspA family protein